MPGARQETTEEHWPAHSAVLNRHPDCKHPAYSLSLPQTCLSPGSPTGPKARGVILDSALSPEIPRPTLQQIGWLSSTTHHSPHPHSPHLEKPQNPVGATVLLHLYKVLTTPPTTPQHPPFPLRLFSTLQCSASVQNASSGHTCKMTHTLLCDRRPSYLSPVWRPSGLWFACSALAALASSIFHMNVPAPGPLYQLLPPPEMSS